MRVSEAGAPSELFMDNSGNGLDFHIGVLLVAMIVERKKTATITHRAAGRINHRKSTKTTVTGLE